MSRTNGKVEVRITACCAGVSAIAVDVSKIAVSNRAAGGAQKGDKSRIAVGKAADAARAAAASRRCCGPALRATFVNVPHKEAQRWRRRRSGGGSGRLSWQSSRWRSRACVAALVVAVVVEASGDVLSCVAAPKQRAHVTAPLHYLLNTRAPAIGWRRVLLNIDGNV